MILVSLIGTQDDCDRGSDLGILLSISVLE